YARRVLAFMDAKGIYRAVLAGCSMGGAIALEAALQAPDRVQGLGVIAAGARFKLDATLVDDLSSNESMNSALERLKGSIFGPGASRALVAHSMRLLRERRPGVLYGDWQACAAFDIHHRLKEITHPVWIAAGEDDRLVPPAAARYLAAHLPNARLQLFSGAGHMLVLEKPDEVRRGLLDFLDSLIKQPD
ncbi:MAG: alpha/beta hydrolase, partial [Anaerolineaceae bacterium]|nr:alpha/beta hydrolase [Anaerolineaceae bacterium]